MSPKPKTVEDWREKRKEKYRNAGDKGGFRVLPIKVLESDPFNELSKSAKIVLIVSLSQLDYWVKKNHKGLPKRESSIGPLRNDGCFSLPSNLLKERGIKGTDTIARVRKELIEAGFWGRCRQEHCTTRVCSAGQTNGSCTIRRKHRNGNSRRKVQDQLGTAIIQIL
jgi:hypothetical protein